MIGVVGGGLAGLELARRLPSPLVLYEASSSMGGRIRSIYQDDGTLAYESGPWRVPHDHHRARALFAEMGKELILMSTRALDDRTPDEPTVPGLTTWEVHALAARDALRADALDLETGYSDQTHSASGSEPYSATDPFYVAPQGFNALVDAIRERIEGACDRGMRSLLANHRVTDVTFDSDTALYTLFVSKRTGHNQFESLTAQCKTLFVCVPPGVFKHWTIFREHAKSVFSAVDSGDLHHVYARDAAAPRGVHVRHPLLGQIVSSQYDESDWFQASYSGGRIARLWHHLRMTSPVRFLSAISRELRDALGEGVLGPTSECCRSHYWPVAFHVWKPVFNFNLDRAVRMAVQPNPLRLPNAYVAGEAFSSYQAWMEGALQTVELALAAFDGRLSRRTCVPTADWVIVEGRVIDVREWMGRHPGGTMPLRNHIGEDVTHLMAHIGHSEQAWAVVHSLKCQ